jgi:predicted site-specific integrase-resolvase
MQTTTRPLLLTEAEAADALGLKPRTLQEWRRRGDGVPFVRVSSRCVRYDLREIERYIAARTCTSTSDVSIS